MRAKVVKSTRKSSKPDPEVLGGVPVFVGTRVPAKTLLDYLEAGHPLSDFLADFPTVHRSSCSDRPSSRYGSMKSSKLPTSWTGRSVGSPLYLVEMPGRRNAARSLERFLCCPGAWAFWIFEMPYDSPLQLPQQTGGAKTVTAEF
ncbi:MAG: hypothetical protein DMG12_24480 [Acidobacteria bacterium]|nr:MAG: hypothetical protein DMG12_24480 [Acidobacteriota bacterium]